MSNICINCIHKDVCYKYRLNYVSAREGSCNDYLNPDLSKYSDNLWKEAYERGHKRGHKEGYELAILDGKTNFSRGECKTCKHRDPEDKKCDCGALEEENQDDNKV